MKTNPIKFWKYNKIQVFAILALHILVYASCKKSSDLSPDLKEIPAEGTFKSELNGEVWEGKSTSGVIADGKMVITTTHANGDKLAIELNGDLVGKYRFTDALNKATYTTKIDGTTYSTTLVSSNMGEVIITKIDTNYLLISGNLDLYLKNSEGKTISFRKGVFFKIPYSYTSLNISYNMQGFINGVPFSATARANKNYITGKTISVIGLTTDTCNITLFITGGDSVGNYAFPQYGNAAYLKKGIYYSYGAGNVEINYIDSVNKLISGKFNFYAVNKNDNLDSVFVRQGTFTNVKYP